MTETPITQTIQLNADGPLDSEMPRLLRQAIRRARDGGITRLLDSEKCIAEIGPPSELSNFGEPVRKQKSFRSDLESLINAHSLENVSNTPDFILASFLASCLGAFDGCVVRRDGWYGVRLEPGNSHFVDSSGVPHDSSPDLT